VHIVAIHWLAGPVRWYLDSLLMRGKLMRSLIAGAVLCALGVTCLVFGQAPESKPEKKIDFLQDVQPIFRAKCYGCHGPKEQQNGLRLDRRSIAMRGGTIPVIGPGNSEGSRLFQKLLNDNYGPQMPPTKKLSDEEISAIKQWIDQGAVWPDSAANEAAPVPIDAGAAQLMETLRQGDTETLRKLLGGSGANEHVNGRGIGGATPLMYAALYGDAGAVKRLLALGADVKLHDEEGATALMWATDDLEKTRVLLEHGADVNAKSDAERTPLMIAASRYGSAPVMKLLLDHGASPSAHAPGLGSVTTPLEEAAYAGDDAVIRLLLERHADLKAAGPDPLVIAKIKNCTACVETLVRAGDQDMTLQMFLSVPPIADGSYVKYLLAHGADVSAKDPAGNTGLMLVAASDNQPVETAREFLARGVDVNARNASGQTAMDFAKLRGNTALVEALLRAGAKDTAPATTNVTAQPADSPRAAVERSLPLLQSADVTFAKKSGCISCHHNTFTSVTVETARQSGIPVDASLSNRQERVETEFLESWRDRVLQGVGIPGDSDTISYILQSLGAQNYPPDATTDAMARFIKNHQGPDGSWAILAHRPPIESSSIEVTAVSAQALLRYAPKPKLQSAEYEQAVARASAWLAKAQPKWNEDRAYRLLGLYWTDASANLIHSAAKELIATQNADGGWSQIATLRSDAYATGEALVALAESGTVRTGDDVYRKGVQFLLSTQMADGSWYVKSRAIALQPLFDGGFPYGRDQFVSAAATNLATQALAFAAR
jgi:ankyrin repeat protein